MQMKKTNKKKTTTNKQTQAPSHKRTKQRGIDQKEDCNLEQITQIFKCIAKWEKKKLHEAIMKYLQKSPLLCLLVTQKNI